ncbi:hypothetical protein [Nocardiopsis oceani]
MDTLTARAPRSPKPSSGPTSVLSYGISPGLPSGLVSAAQAGALLASSAIATWWVTRTPPEEEAAAEGFHLSEAEYAIEPVALPHWGEAVIGAGALVLVPLLAVLLIRGVAAGHIPPRWGGVVLILFPVAVMAGLWWMIGTAPVIGANILLDLARPVFGPASLLLLIFAAATAVSALRRR